MADVRGTYERTPEHLLRLRIAMRETGLKQMEAKHARERLEKEQVLLALKAEYESTYGSLKDQA